MASTSQRQKGRDGLPPTLDVLIRVLNLVKDTCGNFPPAQVAFNSVSILLTTIRVRFPLLCENELLSHVRYLGYDPQRLGLLPAWTRLRQCMSSPLHEVERGTIGSAQPPCPRCDWRVDHVRRNRNEQAD